MKPIADDFEAIAAELKRIEAEKQQSAPEPDISYAGWMAPIDYDPA